MSALPSGIFVEVCGPLGEVVAVAREMPAADLPGRVADGCASFVISTEYAAEKLVPALRARCEGQRILLLHDALLAMRRDVEWSVMLAEMVRRDSVLLAFWGAVADDVLPDAMDDYFDSFDDVGIPYKKIAFLADVLERDSFAQNAWRVVAQFRCVAVSQRGLFSRDDLRSLGIHYTFQLLP